MSERTRAAGIALANGEVFLFPDLTRQGVRELFTSIAEHFSDELIDGIQRIEVSGGRR